MEAGNNNIEQLFKQKFDNFQPDVDPKVWNNIQKSIGKSGKGSDSFIGSLAGKLIIGSAAVAVFSVSTLLFLGKGGTTYSPKNSSTVKSPVTTAQNTNTTTVNANNKTDVKPIVTNISPKNNSVVTHQPSVNTNTTSAEHNLQVNNTPSDTKTTNNTEGNKTETTTNPVNNNSQHPGSNLAEKKHVITPNQEETSTITNPDHEISVVANPARIAKIEFTTSGSSTYAPLTVYFTNKGKAVSEEWSFGDGTFPRFEKNPVYLFEYPGEYTIILTATNEAGKVEKDSIKIKIKSNAFFIPNTFTPNGDGQNDSYKIIRNDNYPFEMTNLEIVIYDRMNGKMAAFNSVDYSWDGRSIKDGRMCPQGTYLVLIKYTSSEDGKSHEERGYLFLKD